MLLPSGRRLVSAQTKAKMILNHQTENHQYPVLPNRDTELYKYYKGIDLTAGVDVAAETQLFFPEYKVTEADIQSMLDYVSVTKRDESISDEVHEARLFDEWRFFEDNQALPFIFNTWQLIKKFQEDKVIWGVGRGSSCASYLLYTLGIHDINSIKFDIDFKEFSKETGDKDGHTESP